jgi:hypothetical protein
MKVKQRWKWSKWYAASVASHNRALAQGANPAPQYINWLVDTRGLTRAQAYDFVEPAGHVAYRKPRGGAKALWKQWYRGRSLTWALA